MTVRVLAIEHEDGTGPGLLGETLVQLGLVLDIARPYLGERLPTTLVGYDGLLVLGGSQSPYSDSSAGWLPEVRGLLSDAIEMGLPTLGICLGGELLAMVAGGEVARADEAPEVGIHRLRMTEAAADDPLFGDLPPVVPAVEWHVEEIVRLPAGSPSLCSTGRFPNQAFRVGAAAWGIQFHMEVLAEAAAAWTESSGSELAAAGLTPEQVIADVAASEPELRRVWSEVAARWAEVVRDRRRQSGIGPSGELPETGHASSPARLR